jgi:hypothetical protein
MTWATKNRKFVNTNQAGSCLKRLREVSAIIIYMRTRKAEMPTASNLPIINKVEEALLLVDAGKR